MTIKKLLFNTSGWRKIEYWIGKTTLEKDASVTDWQLNDMISFQKETILIRLSLIVQSFDSVIISHFRSENVSSNCMKRLMYTM